jgi:hypothetical protein
VPSEWPARLSRNGSRRICQILCFNKKAQQLPPTDAQQLQQAMKVIADPRLVHDARELTRRLLVDVQMALAPTNDHKGVAGPVRLVNLGDHELQLAGWQRIKAASQIGSGGKLRDFRNLAA